MTYSAQDIALIVTSVATAVTAISGFAIPLVTGRSERIRQRNRSIHDAFRAQFDNVLIEADNRAETQKKRIAFLKKAQIAQEHSMPLDSDFTDKDNFDLARLRLDMLGKSYGIETKEIGTYLIAHSAAYTEYFESGYSPEKGVSTDLLQKAFKEEEDYRTLIMSEFEKIWSDINAKYPV